ncbi:hypothetical protein HY383_03220 [Candidatus Daviesbacteria bacterium]|nr:hypothetical protein [Candidatus Daviesbacteria bacterium]
MKHFVPVRVRIEKDVVTYVTRTLKGKGVLRVSIGQEVTPDEIIGSSEVTSGFRTLNLSTLLSVSPNEVEKLMIKTVGQRIYQGELLALKKGGIFGGKKAVISPTDGILDFFNNKTGEVKISLSPKRFDLPAGVYGIVEIVDQQKGLVVIRTQVSRIYGLFGSGRPRDGILHILGKRDDLIAKSTIQTNFDGQILVGGSLFFKDTISAAISSGVSGIISGGLNAKEYKAMASGRLVFPKKLDNDIGISIVVCEGFGTIPIGSDIFEVLREFEGKFVFLDGNKASINLPASLSACLTKIRSTRLPPLQSSGSTLEMDHAAQVAELAIGMRVRIIGNYYLGGQGKLAAIDDSVTLLPSGIKTYLATVETSFKKIQVPVANLEVIV